MSANLVVPPPAAQPQQPTSSAHTNAQHFQQPIPFIPMVPPLTNSFAPPMASVTSGLVENLINNNPTPTTLSLQAATVTTSVMLNNPQQSSTEVNANSMTIPTSAIDNLATQTANQLYIQQQPVQSVTEQAAQNVIQPPSVIPSAYQQSPQSNLVDVNQQFVQSEGENNTEIS